MEQEMPCLHPPCSKYTRFLTISQTYEAHSPLRVFALARLSQISP